MPVRSVVQSARAGRKHLGRIPAFTVNHIKCQASAGQAEELNLYSLNSSPIS